MKWEQFVKAIGELPSDAPKRQGAEVQPHKPLKVALPAK